MDGFRQWALAVCTAAVICSLLRHLFPDNALGRQGRFVLPCVFLCVLLSPISGVFSSVKFPDFTAEETIDTAGLADRMRQQVVAQVTATLEQMLRQSYDEQGWEIKKVVTDMDIDEGGNIRMEGITVYVDAQTARRESALKQVAEKRLGMPVRIGVWEDTG